jgi:hypothetical protein
MAMRVSVMLPALDMRGLHQAADVLVYLGRQFHGSHPEEHHGHSQSSMGAA